jgi:hypothetical protein
MDNISVNVNDYDIIKTDTINPLIRREDFNDCDDLIKIETNSNGNLFQ